jgi:hypothetical protein
MSRLPRLASFVLSVSCSMQVAGGAASRGGADAAGRYMTLNVQTQAIRTNGALVGIRTTMVRDSRALRIRNAALAFGHDWHVGESTPFGFECTLEAGAGGGVSHRYEGIGLYTGLTAAPRLRLVGGRDREPGYNLLLGYGDLVATGRAGFWSPPEGASSTKLDAEWAVELGLRFSLASDAVNAPSQSVATEPDHEQRP